MSPAVDATLTMLPPFSNRCGRAAWLMRKVPVRFTAMIRCQSSKLASTVCANLPMPATLQTTLGGPSWETISFIVAATESGSLTSEGSATAVPPPAVISSTTFCSGSAAMSRAATLPPSPAITSAVAFPTPDAAPVTTATRPPNRPPSAMPGSVCEGASGSQSREPRHRRERAQFARDVRTGGLEHELGGAGLLHPGHALREHPRCARERHRRDHLAGDELTVTFVQLDHVAVVDGEMARALGDRFHDLPPLLPAGQRGNTISPRPFVEPVVERADRRARARERVR